MEGTVEPDFSKPWNLSDVILAVEDEKFHVHRSMLTVWSPVFAKMFTSDFKEKELDEIPLPGKKACEIKEMLLIIYVRAKSVRVINASSLLELAEEYQMAQLFQSCEECLMKTSITDSEAIDFLVLAQTYRLKQLAEKCIKHGALLSLQELRNHVQYHLLDAEYRQRLAERRVQILEPVAYQAKQAKTHLQEAAQKIVHKCCPAYDLITGFQVELSPVEAIERALHYLDILRQSDAREDYQLKQQLKAVFRNICKDFGHVLPTRQEKLPLLK